KDKISLVDNDILTGMTIILGITMPNPRFESQTKRKLVRESNLDKCIDGFMKKNIDKWVRKNKDILEVILDRARSRSRLQELKDASKKSKKQSKKRIEKLLDANERKNRSLCSLFICEGDSAIGGLRSARDKLYQGGIALKGKPMNVSQATIKDILNNEEFSNIMGAIGLTIGQSVDFEKLRFAKIIFLSDSDVDGGHINTLLTNFFFTFWPELFSQGAVCMAKAPLFEIVTSDGTKFVESDLELEEFKSKNSKMIREIHRNKGLGEMSQEAWKHVLSNKDFTRIDISDFEAAKEMLTVCFAKDSAPRKNLLLDEEDRGKISPIENKVTKKKVTKKKVTKKKVIKKKK
ncbi:MAG: hypothetical protein HOJ35_12080, partial [Bdellovibrionales bacterium]|nr:hypothetical protein [Bdellovibrionales bacterium]